MATNKPVVYATPVEKEDITRKVLIWLSAAPDLPVYIVKPENMLQPNETGMCITVIRHAVTNTYITGGKRYEYQFGVIYRVIPSSIDDRLKAMQELNQLAEYAASTSPDLGAGITAKCQITAQSALLIPYENGDEDYQILGILTYEVF